MGLKKRSKSNLLPTAEAAKAKEPATGPGSAVCYCRVMARREKAENARQALRVRQNAGHDGPKFADFQIGSVEALDEFYEALKEKVKAGQGYRVRVAAV